MQPYALLPGEKCDDGVHTRLPRCSVVLTAKAMAKMPQSDILAWCWAEAYDTFFGLLDSLYLDKKRFPQLMAPEQIGTMGKLGRSGHFGHISRSSLQGFFPNYPRCFPNSGA